MGKPRMIILIRHAQSEGNKNREIHQSVPDHRVKLTPEGWNQAHEAGHRLRSLLRPDDKLHFFTSPYRRTRETTEGILHTLTAAGGDDAANPEPSPFRRDDIKVYEEPRLREQDFGNFQPCSAEMERMWQERADYGHFFYRIPNGESAADAYDRVSGFNESLWRLFGEDDFASVCVLVTHGLMSRIFLMKWYHFSVEYFEDLRNVNHCEFVIMKQNPDDGKYILQNKLRTWSELKREKARELQRERALRGELTHVDGVVEAPAIPIRRRWGGCPDGCNHARAAIRRRKPQRQDTKDFLKEYDQQEQAASTYSSQPEAAIQDAGDGTNDDLSAAGYHPPVTQPASSALLAPAARPSLLTHGLAISHLAGRDGGGSQSGAGSHNDSENETERVDVKTIPETTTQVDPLLGCSKDNDDQGKVDENKEMSDKGEEVDDCTTRLPLANQGRGLANSLGDGDDAEREAAAFQQACETVYRCGDQGGCSIKDEDEADQALEEAKQKDQSIQGSVY